jgi:hypothetical protein
LFARIPELEFVHSFRWGITEIFDDAADREEAARRRSTSIGVGVGVERS